MAARADGGPRTSCCFSFFFFCYGDHRDLHSFPTRRSSDLAEAQHPPGAAVVEVSTVTAVEGCRIGLRSETSFDVELKRIDVVDRKSTRLNSSHMSISYAVFCLKKKKITYQVTKRPESPRHT